MNIHANNFQNHTQSSTPLRIIIFLLSFLLAPGAIATSLIYTFQGEVTGMIDRVASTDDTGINPFDYFTLNEPVTYTFLIDYDAPGEHTQFDGDTFPIADIGANNYFYAELIHSLSSTLLPVSDFGNTNLNVDAQKNYGLNVPLEPPLIPLFALYSESFFNPYQIYTTTIAFPDWIVGTTLNAQQKAMVFMGNTSFTDIVNMDLTLTAVDPIPIPPAVWLFLSGLVFMTGIARRKGG